MGALLHIAPRRATTFVDAWLNWINNGCYGRGYTGLTDEREKIKALVAL